MRTRYIQSSLQIGLGFITELLIIMPDDNSNLQNENHKNLDLLGKEELELEKLRIEIAQLNNKTEKDELERKKTALEVRELEKSWYRKPQYVLAALPTALAIIGIIVGFYTGYFKDKIAGLQQDVANYEKQKNQLIADNKKGQEELGKLEDRIDGLTQDKTKASNELEEITKDKNVLLREQRGLDRQIAVLSTDLNRDQNELQRAQGEFARLNDKRQELEQKIGQLEANLLNADLRGLTELWLGNGEKIDDDLYGSASSHAREEIIRRFAANPTRHKNYTEFYEQYLSQKEVTPLQYVSVLCLLVDVTQDDRWRKELTSVTRNYIRATSPQPDSSREVLAKIARHSRSFDPSYRDSLLGEVADELEGRHIVKPNAYYVLDLFFLRVEYLTPPLHRSNPALFLKLVRVACDYEEDAGGGRAVTRLAPVARVALIASRILTRQNYELPDWDFEFLRDGSDLPGLDPPTSRNVEDWKVWANKPQIRRLVKLWFEESDFHTLLSDKDLLNRMVEEYDIS